MSAPPIFCMVGINTATLFTIGMIHLAVSGLVASYSNSMSLCMALASCVLIFISGIGLGCSGYMMLAWCSAFLSAASIVNLHYAAMMPIAPWPADEDDTPPLRRSRVNAC